VSADLTASAGCTTAFDPYNCGPDFVADVSAHETGHFLGLYHTTEDTGDAFDPLADTASCVCALCETDPGAIAACSNNPDGGSPTIADYTVCSGTSQQCGGANLLMYWDLSSAMQGDITPQQAAIMRSNPVITTP
jgi:hypothetical protein